MQHSRHVEHARPSAAAAVHAILSPATLTLVAGGARRLLARPDAWLLGDDHSSFACTARDLAAMSAALGSGSPVRPTLAAEATILARRLQKRFQRDLAAGLVDAADVDVSALAAPDLAEAEAKRRMAA